MREILFRGQIRRRGEKRNMKGEPLPGVWVYGGVLQGIGDFSIIYGCKNKDGYDGEIQKYPVYTNTLGQYTGLKDNHGVKIFEGDILQYTFDDIGMQKAIIKYSEKRHAFLTVPLNDFQYAEIESGTIVGNVWDNPELLEGAERNDA